MKDLLKDETFETSDNLFLVDQWKLDAISNLHRLLLGRTHVVRASNWPAGSAEWDKLPARH